MSNLFFVLKAHLSWWESKNGPLHDRWDDGEIGGDDTIYENAQAEWDETLRLIQDDGVDAEGLCGGFNVKDAVHVIGLYRQLRALSSPVAGAFVDGPRLGEMEGWPL